RAHGAIRPATRPHGRAPAAPPQHFARYVRSDRSGAVSGRAYTLYAHGCGIARNMRAQPISAMFLVKFTISLIFCIGSCTAQKLCIMIEVGTRKMMMAM